MNTVAAAWTFQVPFSVLPARTVACRWKHPHPLFGNLCVHCSTQPLHHRLAVGAGGVLHHNTRGGVAGVARLRDVPSAAATHCANRARTVWWVVALRFVLQRLAAHVLEPEVLLFEATQLLEAALTNELIPCTVPCPACLRPYPILGARQHHRTCKRAPSVRATRPPQPGAEASEALPPAEFTP
eukprot:m.442628 g.442628  ORF g.442628 m.442628 type:complete len:184 (+) comp21476_c0_seq16:2583-3134(+)